MYPKLISIFLIALAFIILLYNKTDTVEVPDITFKYGEIFFLISGIYSIRWLATNNYQRGWIFIILAIVEVFVACLHFNEHNLNILKTNA
jgi:hypothetical protein